LLWMQDADGLVCGDVRMVLVNCFRFFFYAAKSRTTTACAVLFRILEYRWEALVICLETTSCIKHA
jgi:hypothetical protein